MDVKKLTANVESVFARDHRCGKCRNCQRILEIRDSALRTLRQPGTGEHVALMWNTALEESPCQDPPAVVQHGELPKPSGWVCVVGHKDEQGVYGPWPTEGEALSHEWDFSEGFEVNIAPVYPMPVLPTKAEAQEESQLSPLVVAKVELLQPVVVGPSHEVQPGVYGLVRWGNGHGFSLFTWGLAVTVDSDGCIEGDPEVGYEITADGHYKYC
jgi:hypothetical protein